MREKYYLKRNKKVFFRPRDWIKFYDSLSEKQQPYFKFAINTGGRINEIRNVRVKDIDFENKSVTFYVTKIKSRLGEKRPVPREIKISSEFAIWLERWIRKNDMKKWETFKIPSTVAIHKILKSKLKDINVKDWQDFSSHNVRKTHGNWLKALGVDGTEIALRLGHDMNTMLSHYVSPDLFSDDEKVLIKQILGDLV